MNLSTKISSPELKCVKKDKNPNRGAIAASTQPKTLLWNSSGMVILTHRSPQILCRFRLGLRPGVLSLCRPAFSSSFSLVDNASASMDSETALAEVEPTSTLPSDRRVGIVGGVFERGGVLSFGVCGRSEVVSTAIELSMRLSVVMAAFLLGCPRGH